MWPGYHGKRKGETGTLSYWFWGLVMVGRRIAAQDPTVGASLAREMVQITQWAQASEAAQSLAQMAVRGAKGDNALAGRIRERQELAGEWQRRDVARSAAVAQAPDRRDPGPEAANVTRLQANDVRIAEIDSRLKGVFPTTLPSLTLRRSLSRRCRPSYTTTRP
jgi:hypothetical protein